MEVKIRCPVKKVTRRHWCQLGIGDLIKIVLARGLGEYSSTLDEFCKEKKSTLSAFGIILVLGIALGIYLGVYVTPLIDLLNDKERVLALILRIALGVYLGGCVYFGIALVEFFKERKRGPIASHGKSSRRIESQDTTWILDSGTQCHTTGDLRLFSSLTMINQVSWVYGVSGHELPIRGFGTVQFPDFTLENVYYVDGLRRNLISVSKFQLTFGYKITIGKAAYIEEEATGRKICELRTIEGLYELDSVPIMVDRTPAAEGHA